MTTCRDEQLRQRAQHRPHARSDHAPVVGPLTLSALVQAAAVVTAVVVGLPVVAILGIVAAVAAATVVVSWRTVSSLLAGAGLRLARPYEPGEQVRVFVPALNSVEDAEIVRVGPANTTLLTDGGIVVVPNADMLRGGGRG